MILPGERCAEEAQRFSCSSWGLEDAVISRYAESAKHALHVNLLSWVGDDWEIDRYTVGGKLRHLTGNKNSRNFQGRPASRDRQVEKIKILAVPGDKLTC